MQSLSLIHISLETCIGGVAASTVKGLKAGQQDLHFNAPFAYVPATPISQKQNSYALSIPQDVKKGNPEFCKNGNPSQKAFLPWKLPKKVLTKARKPGILWLAKANAQFPPKSLSLIHI